MVQAGADWRYTGRLLATNSDTLPSFTDWRVDRLRAEGVRYLCERGGLMLFGVGRTLLVVRQGSAIPAEVTLANPVDRYTQRMPETL